MLNFRVSTHGNFTTNWKEDNRTFLCNYLLARGPIVSSVELGHQSRHSACYEGRAAYSDCDQVVISRSSMGSDESQWAGDVGTVVRL